MGDDMLGVVKIDHILLLVLVWKEAMLPCEEQVGRILPYFRFRGRPGIFHVQLQDLVHRNLFLQGDPATGGPGYLHRIDHRLGRQAEMDLRVHRRDVAPGKEMFLELVVPFAP